MWCGADFAVENANFAWRSNGDDLFVAHAYPYAEDRSIASHRADETTWASAGLAETTVVARESDWRGLELVEAMFADDSAAAPPGQPDPMVPLPDRVPATLVGGERGAARHAAPPHYTIGSVRNWPWRTPLHWPTHSPSTTRSVKPSPPTRPVAAPGWTGSSISPHDHRPGGPPSANA